MKEYGFDDKQIKYMNDAKKLVDSGKAKSVDDIKDELGHGIMDDAAIRDTLFKKSLQDQVNEILSK